VTVYAQRYRILHGAAEWKKHLGDLNTNGTQNFKTELTQTVYEGTNYIKFTQDFVSWRASENTSVNRKVP